MMKRILEKIKKIFRQSPKLWYVFIGLWAIVLIGGVVLLARDKIFTGALTNSPKVQITQTGPEYYIGEYNTQEKVWRTKQVNFKATNIVYCSQDRNNLYYPGAYVYMVDDATKQVKRLKRENANWLDPSIVVEDVPLAGEKILGITFGGGFEGSGLATVIAALTESGKLYELSACNPQNFGQPADWIDRWVLMPVNGSYDYDLVSELGGASNVVGMNRVYDASVNFVNKPPYYDGQKGYTIQHYIMFSKTKAIFYNRATNPNANKFVFDFTNIPAGETVVDYGSAPNFFLGYWAHYILTDKGKFYRGSSGDTGGPINFQFYLRDYFNDPTIDKGLAQEFIPRFDAHQDTPGSHAETFAQSTKISDYIYKTYFRTDMNIHSSSPWLITDYILTGCKPLWTRGWPWLVSTNGRYFASFGTGCADPEHPKPAGNPSVHVSVAGPDGSATAINSGDKAVFTLTVTNTTATPPQLKFKLPNGFKLDVNPNISPAGVTITGTTGELIFNNVPAGNQVIQFTAVAP